MRVCALRMVEQTPVAELRSAAQEDLMDVAFGLSLD